MYRNLDDTKEMKDDHELAVSIACKKFEEIYPKEMQPEWLKYCMSMQTIKNRNKNWIIKLLLIPKLQLKLNQYWHWNDDGVPVLVQIDPVTGKKEIVICGGPAPTPQIFFEVEVDIIKHSVTVNINIDPNKLDGKKYEINWR